MPFVLGTAGHIDHGKTTLVQALTGINCDRLAEERRRGITIELGFAWLDLPDGQRLGIVDVPGHEKFIKNMVAGAAGIDLLLLVIAADEGVMPQTREHLEICSLLGIRRGLVALTKCDAVDPDWLELVREDTAKFLAGTFLEGAPVLPVSALTGEGLPALKEAIARAVREITVTGRTDLFRLPVDRVFSLKGFGTIVTGTVVSGRAAQNQEVQVYPDGPRTQIRSLQRHEEPSLEAHAGERCAANLQGLEVADIRRGDTIALPDTLFPSDRFLARLVCLRSSPIALKNRTELHFHHGTLETQARVHFPDREELGPGGESLAELRFERPLVAVFGDHCVLRAASPLRTVAGGLIISPLPPALRARDPGRAGKLALLARLPALSEAGEDARLTASVLELRGPAGASHALLRVLTGLPEKRLDAALQSLSSAREALCWDREARMWTERRHFDALAEACLARARELHEKNPLQAGFARQALEGTWSGDLPPRLTAAVLAALLRDGRLASAGELIRLPGAKVVLDRAQQALREGLLAACRRAGRTPPGLREILADLGVSEKAAAPVLRVLTAEGSLVKVREGLYYAGETLSGIIAETARWFETHDDLTLSDMRELFGLSRKYLIALLEYLDQEKITVRIGDRRQFRGRLSAAVPREAPRGAGGAD